MKRLLFLFLVLFVAETQVLPSTTAKPFLMFQRTFFGTGRPSDSYFQGFGIQPMTVVFQDQTGCPPYSQSKVQTAAANNVNNGRYISIDDECLDVLAYDESSVGVSTATANMNTLKQEYLWYKAITSQKVGLYTYTPEEVDYHWNSPSGFDLPTYQAINDVMQPVADVVDYLSPSIYNTIGNSATMQWKVQTMTQEAVRLAKGKPVYPYISPQYYIGSGHTDMELVSYDYWKMILNTIRSSGGKGAIIFIWQPITWDSTAGWWVAMKEFLKSDVNSIDANNEITAKYQLDQNYPNPFNPSTTIKFELPRASQVTLSVFDVLGREVSVLVNERKAPGNYEVNFDGSNLASGVYFYRLQAGDFVATKRLLHLQ